VTATATLGTPADAGQASANVGETVTLEGQGFVEGETKVALEAMIGNGTPFIIAVEPVSINAEGTSLTFVVPTAARAGPMSLLDGGAGIPLQVVPTITSVSSATPGQISDTRGSGFIEGFITVRFGTVDVVDGGPLSTDDVNVWDWTIQNDRADAIVPVSGSAPVVIITEGGTSNAVSP
jgi:hypothetical protein